VRATTLLRTPPAVHTRRLSYADDARGEGAGEQKHEFFNGEVDAMAGGTIEHGRMGTRACDEE